MKTYNTYPYFDDFDESKNYHQVLFKPEYAVQARELTQLQTILRSQIEKFGNHIFQHGSVVIPGNTYTDLGVPYFRFNPDNTGIDYTIYEGATINGTISNIKAKVKKVIAPISTDNYWYVYFSYAGRTESSTSSISSFIFNETIVLDENTNVKITSMGKGSFAHINDGVFYIDGSFVTVNKQSIVIDKFSDKPSCHVVLKIDETITTYNDDSSLLDNARGFNNYAAPGADRIKINLTLTSLPLGSSFNDSDYVELMRYNKGILEEHVRYSKYSELEKNLARRTFDESGNYIVNGFDTIVREHKKTSTNNGVYDNIGSPKGDINKMVVSVNPGKAYIKGFETERLSDTLVTIDKARTEDHIIQKDSVSLTAEYGQYILVTDLVMIPDISAQPEIKIYNGKIGANGDQIASARLLGIQKHLRDDTKPEETIYRFYLTGINITSGSSSYSFGVIKIDSTFIGSVVHRCTLSNLSANFNTAINAFNDVRKIGIDADPWGDTIPSDYSARIKAWDQNSSHLYVSKIGKDYEIPREYYGIGLIQYNTNENNPIRHPAEEPTATARIDTFNTIFSNSSSNISSQIPIFELPFSHVNSIKNKDGSATVEYTIQGITTITTNSSGDGLSVPITGINVILPSQDPDFFAVDSTGLTYTPGNDNIIFYDETSKQFEINDGKPDTTFTIVFSGVKVASPKTKTKTNYTQTQAINVSSGEVILLKHADVYFIESIKLNESDVRDKFIFNTGQTAYSYTRSYLVSNTPLSGDLEVKYNYFQHSAGDYFSIDSYEQLGQDYYSQVVPFSYTNRTIDLRSCLDFRPRISSSEDSVSTNIPKNGTKLTAPVRIYVPRIDLVTLEKSSGISVVRGVPSETPVEPIVGDDSIFIASLYIPPYTENASLVKVKTINNKVYTMARIAKLEDRILKIEENMLLTELESSLINRDIIDAGSGLSRFKSGYLVEDFSDPMYIADFYNENFNATYNNSFLRPAMESVETPFSISDDTKIEKHPDGYITLPYTEVTWINQNVSSHVTNVNPFNVFTWHGTLTLNPSFDNVNESFKIIEYKNVTTIRVPGPWIRWNFYNENGTILELPVKFAGPTAGWERKDIVSYLSSIGAIDAPSGWNNTDVIIAGN